MKYINKHTTFDKLDAGDRFKVEGCQAPLLRILKGSSIPFNAVNVDTGGLWRVPSEDKVIQRIRITTGGLSKGGDHE